MQSGAQLFKTQTQHSPGEREIVDDRKRRRGDEEDSIALLSGEMGGVCWIDAPRLLTGRGCQRAFEPGTWYNSTGRWSTCTRWPPGSCLERVDERDERLGEREEVRTESHSRVCRADNGAVVSASHQRHEKKQLKVRMGRRAPPRSAMVMGTKDHPDLPAGPTGRGAAARASDSGSLRGQAVTMISCHVQVAKVREDTDDITYTVRVR
jgi:hypothetical protein